MASFLAFCASFLVIFVFAKISPLHPTTTCTLCPPSVYVLYIWVT